VPGCRPTKRWLQILSLLFAQLFPGYCCVAQGDGGAGYPRGFAVSGGQAQNQAPNYPPPTPPPPPGNLAQSQAPTYPVDGVVENSLTHEPIARVLVEGMQDRVLTDDEGLRLVRGASFFRPGTRVLTFPRCRLSPAFQAEWKWRMEAALPPG
jgi:hypothetical protein